MLKKVVSYHGSERMRAIVTEHIRENACFEGRYFFLPEEGTNRDRGIVCVRYLSRYLGEVKHLFVMQQDRGQGVGQTILKELEARTEFPMLCATVLADNRESCRAFEAVGYREVERFMQEDRETILYFKKLEADRAVS